MKDEIRKRWYSICGLCKYFQDVRRELGELSPHCHLKPTVVVWAKRKKSSWARPPTMFSDRACKYFKQRNDEDM